MEESNVLVNDLLEKMNFKTRKEAKLYYKFIEEKFIPFRSQSSFLNIKKNVESLKEMKPEDVMFVKSRLKQLEEDNDPSKYFPTLVALFLMVQTMYFTLFKMYKSLFLGMSNIVVIGISIAFLMPTFFLLVKRRNVNIYFNSLFNELEFKKESQSESQNEEEAS